MGKSTLVKLLQRRLLENDAEQPYLFATFNAWEYEHTDNLQAGIAQEMITALSSPRPTEASLNSDMHDMSFWDQFCWGFYRFKLTFGFAKAIHGVWPFIKFLLIALVGLCLSLFLVYANDKEALFIPGIGACATGVGLLVYLFRELKRWSANPLAKEFLTYLKLPDYAKHLGTIPVMRKNIKTMSQVRLNPRNKKSKRLLYVVDDLDRCDTKSIVKVFESIRLVLEIPQVIVIIAIYQRIALSALALHYENLAVHHPSGSSLTIARDYLSKIIHLPITLSAPDKQSVNAYLQHLWKQDQRTYIESIDVDKNNKPDADSTMGSEAPITNVEQRFGLSAAQKHAFEGWINYFGLVNPRQVKRLFNSYNLLRHYYAIDQHPEEKTFTTKDKTLPIFPMMITLFALEYINNLVKVEQHARLKHYLRHSTAAKAADDPRMNKTIAEVIRRQIYDGKDTLTLFDAVEPFVLPAIERLEADSV